jgi:hypothetical protein
VPSPAPHHTFETPPKVQLITTVPQETKDMYKSAQAARNRRLGLIMLSVAFVFFMGIVMKRVMLGLKPKKLWPISKPSIVKFC